MKKGFGILRFLIFLNVLITGCIGLRAQYSGAVGYVQVVMSQGYNFCCNPLVHSNNTVTEVMGPVPDSTAVYLWDVTAQRFSPPSVFHGTWSSNCVLSLGRGFVVYAPVTFTNTFVGGVLEGNLTNAIAGSNRLSLVSSLVPQAASLNFFGFPGTDGDNVYVPVTATHSLSSVYTFLADYGWFDAAKLVDTNGPVIPVASCFFVQHPGPDIKWVRTFFVNNTLHLNGAAITGLRVSNKTATLNVGATAGTAYDVEFSTDRVSWTTIATNQTASTWTGSMGATAVGYFRVK